MVSHEDLCWGYHTLQDYQNSLAVLMSHNIHMYHKLANTLRSMVVHPKDQTPKEHKCGTIYNITCDIDSSHTYIDETKRTLSQRFKEHTNLDKPTGIGDHCRATGHSVCTKNTKVLTHESNRRKVKEDIYIEPLLRTETRDTMCLPSTTKLSRRNLRQHMWHQYVNKACSWRVETSCSSSTIKLQSKLNYTTIS